MSDLLQPLVPLIANLGALALAATVVFILSVRFDLVERDLRRAAIIGIAFGCVSVFVVSFPIDGPQGAKFDTRAAPIVLSALFGGPVGGGIAAVMGAIARYNVGGPVALGGVVSFFLYTGVGLIVGRIFGERVPTAGQLVWISLGATVAVLPSFFIGQSVATGLSILGRFWHVLVLGNITGMVFLGLLMRYLVKFVRSRDEITKREIEAKSARDEMEAILLSVPDAVITVSDDHIIRSVNPRVEEMFGWHREDLVGRNIDTLVPENFHGLHDGNVSGYIGDPSESTRDMTGFRPVSALHRDGHTIPVLVSLSKYTYNGKPSVVATVHNTSDIIETNERLSDSQEMAKMGDFDWNIETGKVVWSRALHQLLEVPQDYSVDINMVHEQVHHPDDLAYINGWLQDAIASGAESSDSQVYRLMKQTGDFIYVRTSIRIMRQNGVAVRMRGSVIDITELVETQKELEKAKVQAEMANMAKSDFLAAMSHELRTPLNAIAGFADMIRSQVFGRLGHAKYGEYAHDIAFSAELLISLVNDILDLAKIEAHEYELHPVDIDVEEALRDAAGLVVSQSERGEDKIIVDVAEGADRLFVDLRSFRQIVINLLSNADKFTPSDKRIRVTARNEDAMGTVIAFVDKGRGIAAEDIDRVLEPFVQARANAMTTQAGTGLGLSLAKRLTELNGGFLHIESALGEGTTVTLTFPPPLSN